MARPELRNSEDAAPKAKERALRVAELRERLLEGVSEIRSERTDEEQARWLLASLLDFHRREDKAAWWEYFRLRELPEEDLIDEPQAVAGLEFVKRLGFKIGDSGRPTKSVIDRYRYPAQEMEIVPGSDLHEREQKLGKLVASDRAKRTIDIEKGPSRAERHPTSVFAHTFFSTEVIEDSIFAFGEEVAAAGSVVPSKNAKQRAFRDLLLRTPPRLTRGTFSGASASVGLAVDTVGNLSRSVLPIDAVHEAARELGVDARIVHRGDEDDCSKDAYVKPAGSWQEGLELIESGDVNVLGGTAWLWSRPDLEQIVDVLFVDEAGQVSLANVVAVSRAARSVVWLGDPQQREQPIMGTHPVVPVACNSS